MAQFDTTIIFPLIWSIFLILFAYHNLSVQTLTPHFFEIKKIFEKKNYSTYK